MYLTNKLWFLFLASMALVACSENKETPVNNDYEKYEHVKIAVILPFEEIKTDWHQVLDWVKDNIAQSSGIVIPEYEIYDENTIDIEKIADELAKRKDIAAVIGCYHSENTKELAYKCARTYKPVFTFSTSEELQRAFGQRGFLWSLVESDITQCELLLIKAERAGARRVSLICKDDIYGKTFKEWFAFQSAELGMEPVGVWEYSDEELEEQFLMATKDEVDYIVCVPSSVNDACRMVEAYRASGFMGRLLFSDVANSEEFVSKLGLKANNMEGISMVADPSSGFSLSYEVKFGKPPLPWEAHIYDAVMITCYAHRYAAVNDVEINQAISNLLSQKAKMKGMWASGAMTDTYKKIEQGGTPGFSGASGNLDFVTDKYTSIQYSTFAHWMVYDGEIINIDYDVRSEYSVSSVYAAWEWNKQFMQQFEEEDTSFEYPEKGDNWAVVIAASEGWTNYRHQADALAFYQMLKRLGYDDEHILLIMADDIAYHPNNPSPGVIQHTSNGANLYKDIQVDYRLADISPEILQSILLGEKENSLPSNSSDNVLLFWSGHGEKANWMWRENDVFSAERLHETLVEMHNKGKYRKFLGLIETCYSGSMGIVTDGIPGVLFITAANEQETSKAEGYSCDLGVWMTNRFTTTLLDCVENNPDVTFRELYYHLFSSTLGSHVTVYNAKNYGNMYTNTMKEFLK